MSELGTQDVAVARSRIPFSEHRTANRMDPFYDYIWKRSDSAIAWRSRREMRSRRDARLGRSASWFVPSPAEREHVGSDLLRNRRELKLATLGAVHGWRTATVEQVTAITGRQLISGKGSALRQLYTADLLDVGASGGFNGWAVNNDELRGWLLHPSRTDSFKQRIDHQLTFPESVAVTGGREWLTGGQYDRHNVLATEFALRAAEFTRCATVIGEQWSSASDLLWEAWGRKSPFASGAGGSKAGAYENRGDMTLVRRDGLRIAVEVTASTSGKAFVQKVWKWLHQMRQAPLEHQGTVLLFLVAGEQEPRGGEVQRLRREVQRGIQQAIGMEPGYAANRMADRVFVASWSDLFPDRHQLVTDFEKLPVLAPRGLRSAAPTGDIWERVHLLDEQEVPYSPADDLDPLAVVQNASMLHATPHWLRGERPQLAGDSVKMCWPNGVPGIDRNSLKAKGVAGEANPYVDRVLV